MTYRDKNKVKMIKHQLGREPENLNEIELYCDKNNPLVISTLPFNKKKGVFPTLYWLSCPFLVKRVSKLEDQGLVKKLTKRTKSNFQFKEKLEKAHLQYANKRFSLLTCKQIKKIKKISDDILDVIKNSGVGGIRDKKGIKCLHTHLADYLINKQNPVGEIVHNKLPELMYNKDEEIWEVEGCEGCSS